MKQKLSIMALLFAFLVSGCSSLKVVPEPVQGGTINAADNSQTVTKNGVSVTARADSSTMNAYNLDSTVTAFHLTIKNDTSSEIAFSEESFVLSDDQGIQYTLLTPDKLRDMLKKDSYYLMPYPYVGFYYLEDFQKTSFYNRLNSSLPYYYELYPQDLFTRSLPLTSIIPAMKVEGLLYFKIDMSAHKDAKIHIYRKGVSRSLPPDFILPFKTVK